MNEFLRYNAQADEGKEREGGREGRSTASMNEMIDSLASCIV